MSTPTLRDRLRQKTIGAEKHFASQTIEIDGETYEVRQPNVLRRNAILKAAGVTSGKAEEANLAELLVTAVIYCVVVPGTTERVFEEADKASLMDQPTGGFVDKLGEVALKLMNIEPERAAKNSEGTPNAG